LREAKAERSGDRGFGSQRVRVHRTESGAFADRAHPPVRGAPLETLTVVAKSTARRSELHR
jgi:hypothetical protein